MSALSPGGNASQPGPSEAFKGGSTSKCDGQPFARPTALFQERAIPRRAASFAASRVVAARYDIYASTVCSFTSAGAMCLPEQYRIRPDRRAASPRSVSWLRRAAQSDRSGMPRVGTSYSPANQTSARRTLDLWFCNVFSRQPAIAWCSMEIGKRIAVQRAGMVSKGRASAFAIWRREQVQCCLSARASVSALSIARSTSANEGSNRAGAAIGIGAFTT